MNTNYYTGDNRNNIAFRQLPTASTLPGYPTVPTSPVHPGFQNLMPQSTSLTPITPSPTLVNPNYTQAYLRSQIGKKARIEFLVGTNSFIDKFGIIEEVGISYIVLKDINTGERVMCDLYSIKFVTFYD